MSLRAAAGRVSLVTWLLVGAVALYVAPLALARYFPGVDAPWHAAAIAVLHRHDEAAVARDFAGYFAVDHSFSSYLTLYYLTDALAYVAGDVAVALQLVIAGYVVAFAAAARRLLRAFGGDPALALLALPAVYSATLGLGFLTYALAYPLTFWLWAVARESMIGPRAGRRLVAAGVLTLAVSLSHPFAAAVAVGGAWLIAATHATAATARRAATLVAVVLAGAVPAVLAIGAVSGDAGAPIPHLMSRMGTLDRILAQPFTPVLTSVERAPGWLFAFAPAAVAVVLVIAGVAAAVWLAVTGERVPRDTGRWWRRYVPELALALTAMLYLATPFTFEWPRYWFGAQPRLLPVVWMCALLCVRARRPRARAGRWLAPAVAVCLAGGAAAMHTLAPFAAESADLRAVIAAAAPGATTLALIEQPRAGELEVTGPWRHAGAYVMVERGGFVANLPFARPAHYTSAGGVLPVHLHPDHPPIPPAPGPGDPRAFDWRRHGGWDQFLIRDTDPAAPHAYFAGIAAAKVELVARRGRWRLYARVQ